MLTDTRSKDLVKMFHLKKVGLALASLWVIVLVAAGAATIYREFDGQTVRTVTAQNIDLSTSISSINMNLDAVQIDNAQLTSNLVNSQIELTALKKQLGSYITSLPLKETAPKAPLSIGIRFFP